MKAFVKCFQEIVLIACALPRLDFSHWEMAISRDKAPLSYWVCSWSA